MELEAVVRQSMELLCEVIMQVNLICEVEA